MIKKIIALAACVSIVFAFSACGDDDNKSSGTVTTDETTTEAQTTEITTEEKTDAPYEVDTTEPQESDVNLADGVLESSYYTMKVGDEWDMTTGSDSIVFMKKKGETDLDSAPNIAIMFSSLDSGDSSEKKLEDLKSQYEPFEDYYTIDSAETTKIGDYDACVVVLSTPTLEIQTKTKQICIIGESGEAIITYTALSDVYDETISEIDDMISTIVLK